MAEKVRSALSAEMERIISTTGVRDKTFYESYAEWTLYLFPLHAYCECLLAWMCVGCSCQNLYPFSVNSNFQDFRLMVHILIKSQIHFTHQVVVCDGNECDFYLGRKFRLICAAAYLTLQYSIFHCESNHHRYIFLMVDEQTTQIYTIFIPPTSLDSPSPSQCIFRSAFRNL